MQTFLKHIKQKAKENPKRIVFSDPTEERVLLALPKILKAKIALPVLVGDEKKIINALKKHGIKWQNKVAIIDPASSSLKKEFAKNYYEIRQEKGITLKQAEAQMLDPTYFATMLVHTNHADGMVSGPSKSTAEKIRPALQIIKTKEPFHKVSGVFFMLLKNRFLMFADAAVTINPNSRELAEIAIDTAETARKFNIKPRIALLSFSTAGSANHPLVDKVREAADIVKYERPDLLVEGEMQVDAALVPEVCTIKFAKSKIKGNANILIFPDLQSGNIAYKLVERLAKAKAIGPILQGLKKPINDLSRGCSVEDIVHVTAMTVCECQDSIKYKI